LRAYVYVPIGNIIVVGLIKVLGCPKGIMFGEVGIDNKDDYRCIEKLCWNHALNSECPLFTYSILTHPFYQAVNDLLQDYIDYNYDNSGSVTNILGYSLLFMIY